MVTDPISDFIIRLQNASRANKESVSLPYSQMKFAVAEILVKAGYLKDIDKKSKKGGMLTVALSYKNSQPTIQGVKRLSKPSRRTYLGVRDVKPVKRGHGLLVLSTPAGVMSGKDAHDKHVGGEALFEIW